MERHRTGFAPLESFTAPPVSTVTSSDKPINEDLSPAVSKCVKLSGETSAPKPPQADLNVHGTSEPSTTHWNATFVVVAVSATGNTFIHHVNM